MTMNHSTRFHSDEGYRWWALKQSYEPLKTRRSRLRGTMFMSTYQYWMRVQCWLKSAQQPQPLWPPQSTMTRLSNSEIITYKTITPITKLCSHEKPRWLWRRLERASCQLWSRESWTTIWGLRYNKHKAPIDQSSILFLSRWCWTCISVTWLENRITHTKQTHSTSVYFLKGHRVGC